MNWKNELKDGLKTVVMILIVWILFAAALFSIVWLLILLVALLKIHYPDFEIYILWAGGLCFLACLTTGWSKLEAWTDNLKNKIFKR